MKLGGILLIGFFLVDRLESETNKEQLKPKDKKQRVVFDQRVCFLAACAAGDFDEISKLLSRGLVDINVSQEDGMTALHQVL